MSRLKAVALVLSGALASMLFCGWLIVGHIESDAGALAEAREEGYAAAEEDRLAIVVDRPIAEGNSSAAMASDRPAMGLHTMRAEQSATTVAALHARLWLSNT